MIGFDDAPAVFSHLLINHLQAEATSDGRIIRDIYGRLSFITSHPYDARHEALQLEAAQALGAWGAGPTRQLIISLSDDMSGFWDLLKEPSLVVTAAGQPEVRMIDRRLAGDDWLMRPSPLVANPSRLIFYSVKGGVGRSTALAVTAAEFAAQGLNVLVIDLDLEAPGLGSLLLRPDDMPTFGVVDWFAAVAAGADAKSLISEMTGPSPFTSARSLVDVVPAIGRRPGAYLSKLARAYTPGSVDKQYLGYTFPKKANALLAQLASRQRYDIVLVDARAGLHETSGGLILGIGAKALLFGVDTFQTFEDFRLLFNAFNQAFDPAMHGADLRSAFKMVHSKAPRDEKDRRRFRERSWEIWSNSLYDDVDPVTEFSGTAFVFDLGDEDAPHYPLEIIDDKSYARFDPRTETYPLSADAYGPVFGRFLLGVRILVGLP